MSIYGVTKGTKFEEQIDKNGKGEEQGAGMYAGLAYLAKERGLDELSEVLLKIAADEMRHAGMYAVLNGHTNEDILQFLKKIAPAESNAFEKLNQFASQVREIGLEDAAKQIESIAVDERRHGELLVKLVNKASK
ncbi:MULTISPECIES: ferritin family protein [Clostridium]|uniref:Ferritin family protein n=1 Tax=Clostridium frigoriphilum TaxID=443253 RepID=A0ABU7UP78_9CLOT|nr:MULTISPECIES: ferritin family protein [Clostridium]MBU3099513.1 rubrerythrin [Clostridium sp. DSM 17811]MCB2305771.1 rubrerythrin [Clostridium estertheticum]MCB2347052.1 rubrerythrin [Clostridium estertheticum]MCB2348126.1 rubrerythrin [Clostridium estertheticum]WAG45765.1 rubrerythrin [Clostridium estertheticum]